MLSAVRVLVACVLVVGSCAFAAPAVARSSPNGSATPMRASSDDSGAVKAFTVHDPRINESSGLAASRLHPGVVYTLNDSGNSPRIYAIGPDGRTKAVLTIAGAHNRDWEAMALGRDDEGRPAIYIGDIGDNLDQWSSVTVYRVREPKRLRDRTLRATAFRLTYPDGPRNAEAMMIDPRTNRLYIASKELSGTLYRAPAHLRTSRTNRLHTVAGDVPLFATDAAFAPDGRTFVIRTYFDATVYSAPDERVAHVGIPGQKQGEGITYTADGRSLLLGSEGENQPVWRVPVPEEALPSPSASPTPSAAADASDDSGSAEPGSKTTIGILILVAVAFVGIVALLRHRAS